MLLRRVIEHVKDQNWTAVALDFVIVVVGVFVGLQVNNWNQQRIDRALEREYLGRLLVDVEVSIASTQDSRAFVQRHTGDAQLILNSALACTLAEDQRDRFANGLKQMGKIAPATYALGTMNELQSTGNFSILRSAETRDLLNDLARSAAYQADLFPLIHDSRVRENSIISRKVVFLHQDYVRSREEIEWEDIRIDFNALCRDEEFLAAVSTVITRNFTNIDFHDRALAKLEIAKAALQAELGIDDGAGGLEGRAEAMPK